MTTITRRVLSANDLRDLEDFIVRAAGGESVVVSTTPPFFPSPTTKAELETLVVDAGWPKVAFLEAYDTLLVQGRIHEFREVVA